MKQFLSPSLDDLRLECVLMQAWKKTSSYLRSHSWYADTLGIDYESLRLPQFISEIQERLRKPEKWQPRPIELVPAPKKQRWTYKDETWAPAEKKIDLKIRPLAHMDLQDQVVATAIMLCLADRVETALGNSRLPIKSAESRRKVIAYGHRLYCDQSDRDNLHHRWGSSKLYRQYFQDYQTFLERSKIVAKELAGKDDGHEIAIVQGDLSKFYDRVRPELLKRKLKKFQKGRSEKEFFTFVSRVFDWKWVDTKRATSYAKNQNIPDFEKIALPQGLVTAGFFANIALYDFDLALRNYFGRKLPKTKFILEDASYYVDDLRIVLTIPKGTKEDDVKERVLGWLQDELDTTAPGLQVSKDKTQVTVEGREKRFLVAQSKEANRIQNQVSDVFDMLHGTELIAAIEGFFHTQQKYSKESLSGLEKSEGLLIGVPDMGDDTATRFAAGRFRRTFRSLRPLLPEEPKPLAANAAGQSLIGLEIDEEEIPKQLILTKKQLDERAKFFSALLIDEWIRNPGNVRLLRIALDLYPDFVYLEQILTVLRPCWENSSVKKAKREVRVYCLAEIFRAGATETGFVREDECLPDNLDMEEYNKVLVKEGRRIIKAYLRTQSIDARFPWYLMQQVFLYLGARNAFPKEISETKARGGKHLLHYWKLAKFMGGEIPVSLEQRAILLIIAKTGFNFSGFDFIKKSTRVSDKFLSQVDAISPAVAKELWHYHKRGASLKAKHSAQRLGLENHAGKIAETTLADLAGAATNPFFEEENLLELAQWLLSQPSTVFNDPVSPWRIICSLEEDKIPGYTFGKIKPTSFDLKRSGNKAGHLFTPPDWCNSREDRQKIQTGFLLRFALRGSTIFYSNTAIKADNRIRYIKPTSHWEQHRYSGYQGRETFGPPWLPISSFSEDILFQLLRWPGSGVLSPRLPINKLLNKVKDRLTQLRKQRGEISASTFLEQDAPWPTKQRLSVQRNLRIGIVQSVIPDLNDYSNHLTDPELNDPLFRSRRRAHLSAIMEAVAQMLRLRETHRQQAWTEDRIIDLLIFPELAIHPQDVDSLILPFVRKHRCMVLFGQVYHPRDNQTDAPLINSCLWMIPEWSRAQGLQIRRIEQGKNYLAEGETLFRPQPIGFRPAQWLINYQWHRESELHRPLVLSASVCYDATDLTLAADLRSRCDLYIVCALNKDVGTFDRMSDGLHYHMYQGLIVVNNGQFGGSNFYMPFKDPFHRQILHLHGQPQASIAFAEISPQKLIERPTDGLIREPEPILPEPAGPLPHGNWKTPPAGWERNRH